MLDPGPPPPGPGTGPADARVGRVLLGRYRVVSVLGEGGMGKVYLAEQRMGTVNRKVAIKTMSIDLAAEPQAVQRFQRECETVVQLAHPNTIQIHDFGTLEDGALYIVMEFVEGRSLADVLKGGPLELPRVDAMLIQICSSLHEAHLRGIVHRDLKPENILLTDRAGQRDFVKVVDFGIAKRLSVGSAPAAQITLQGTLLGTPPYMSPEQFTGTVLDARSDVYALAMITYEMITGVPPFTAQSPWEWATKHLTVAPTPLEKHPPGAALPAPRRDAVMRALAKNRDERPATALQFLQDFTGVRDTSTAWTLATSGSGLVLPRPTTIPPGDSTVAVPGYSSQAPPPPAPIGPSFHGSGAYPGASVSLPPPVGPAASSGNFVWAVLAVVLLAMLGALAMASYLYYVDHRGGPTADPTHPRDVPGPAHPPAQGFASVHHEQNAVAAERAVGARDQQAAQIAPGGMLTLEAALGMQVVADGTGAPELVVYLDDARSGPYGIDVATSQQAFSALYDGVQGSASVDLDRFHVPACRFVRIVNRSATTSVFLDAVQVLRLGPAPAGGQSR